MCVACVCVYVCFGVCLFVYVCIYLAPQIFIRGEISSVVCYTVLSVILCHHSVSTHNICLFFSLIYFFLLFHCFHARPCLSLTQWPCFTGSITDLCMTMQNRTHSIFSRIHTSINECILFRTSLSHKFRLQPES